MARRQAHFDLAEQWSRGRDEPLSDIVEEVRRTCMELQIRIKLGCDFIPSHTTDSEESDCGFDLRSDALDSFCTSITGLEILAKD